MRKTWYFFLLIFLTIFFDIFFDYFVKSYFMVNERNISDYFNGYFGQNLLLIKIW